MIVRKHHKVLVQGITGRQGTFWTEAMQQYGTNVVAGVNPKKAGDIHLGVNIFASAIEAVKAHGAIDVSVLFIPPLKAKSAVTDACEAGIPLIICLAEHIPQQDVMEMHHVAKLHGTRIVGPNTAGLVTPGECFVGIMPAFNDRVFQPGNVGVISRSGSLGTLVSLNLSQQGIGQSVFYGIGGDPMIGTSTKDALQILDKDERTQAVVICGEIGGNAEEQAAEYALTMQKPVVAYITGRVSPEGKKMGHAGAIVADGKGDYDSKRRALESAGVNVADVPSQIASLIHKALM